MQPFQFKQSYKLADLLAIVAQLRCPEGGCPWDLAQTHESIRQNFIEETYEAVDAIDQKDTQMLKEELGDVLLQVALHSEMEAEQGSFCFDDVCDGICKKLILRHPHVFGEVQAATTEQVLRNWDEIKKAEKGQKTGADAVLAVPLSLPALMRAQKVQKRAGKAGADIASPGEALSLLTACTAGLKPSLDAGEGVRQQLGEALFYTVALCRLCGADAEEELTRATDSFTAAFIEAERTAADGAGLSPKEAENLWSGRPKTQLHQ